MTGDNMKSEILNRPHVKIARIQNKSRRKVAHLEMNLDTKTVSENPTLCVSENSKCSKLVEFSKLLESQLEKTTEGNNNENKTSNEEPKLSKEESQETRHLKELLLLHLDLIQQQQELILMKDRQLHQITQEKETLRCRLERMERRMSLLRSGSRGDTHMDLIDAASPTPTALSNSRQLGKGIKRKNSFEPQSLVKKFATIARNEYNRSRQQSATPKARSHRDASTPSRIHRDSHSSRAYRDSQSDHEDTSSQGSRHSQVSQRSTKSKDSQKNKTKITFRTPGKSKQKVKSRRIPKDECIMRTDCMYYVPQEEIVPMDISPKKATEQKEEVVVPSFRIKQIPRGYTMEGTENLGDEIYAKRHQKPEVEEKRRKRWDMQRVREQKALERLQQGRCYRGVTGTSNDEEDEFESFLPYPDKIEFLEICDDIPVSAFGFPLPNLKQTDFELPWFDLERKKREEKCRLRARKR